MPKRDKPQTPNLIPEADFEKALKKILSVTKEESDRQLAEFQASNKAGREEKKLKETGR